MLFRVCFWLRSKWRLARFSNNIAAARRDRGWMFINKANRILRYIRFENVQFLGGHVWVAEQNGLFGTIDQFCNVRAPLQYQSIRSSGGLVQDQLIFRRNGKEGVMTLSHEILIDAYFDYIWSQHSGLYHFRNDNLEGVMNLRGYHANRPSYRRCKSPGNSPGSNS
jgi:hypothetical protein